MAETNYGLLLQKEDTPGSETWTVIGKVIECGFPKITTGAVDTTNHSSGGYGYSIPNGLISLSSFDAKLELEVASLAAIYADMVAKTIANYQITIANTLQTIWGFAAFPLSIEPASSNAQKPDELMFGVTFQPTGPIDFDVSVAAGDWFDNVTQIFMDIGAEYTLATTTGTHQIVLYAARGGSIYTLVPADWADLTLVNTVAAKATVSATGLIEGVATGDTTLTVSITTVPTITTFATISVP